MEVFLVLFILTLWLISILWIASEGHSLSKRGAMKGSESVAMWMIAALLFGILVLPMWLLMRGKYRREAEEIERHERALQRIAPLQIELKI